MFGVFALFVIGIFMALWLVGESNGTENPLRIVAGVLSFIFMLPLLIVIYKYAIGV